MDTLAAVEARRIALQDELDGRKTQKERNRLGQFATPTLLASDMLAYALTLVPESAPVRFLDPAIGTGSFYAALLRHFPRQQVRGAVGVEIDPHYGKPARGLWLDRGLKIELDDFTVMKPPLAAERFNLVVCNPPYVRHHHMGVDEKGRLRAATTAASGVRITGLAGLYCYFLGLAHAWLADDGIAGWLIPSEFMDVNYGGPVKRYFLTEVELLRIHRFDPNDLQFGDALVSSAVVWFSQAARGTWAPGGIELWRYALAADSFKAPVGLGSSRSAKMDGAGDVRSEGRDPWTAARGLLLDQAWSRNRRQQILHFVAR
jgi:adenine-specific DNA-methyltransferase